MRSFIGKVDMYAQWFVEICGGLEYMTFKIPFIPKSPQGLVSSCRHGGKDIINMLTSQWGLKNTHLLQFMAITDQTILP